MVKKTWEKPICDLCGSDSQHVVYDNMTYWEYPGTFRTVQCDSCGLIFISPRPPLSEIARYYAQDNYFGRDIGANESRNDDVAGREKMYGPVYELIAAHKKKGSILDIGAGTGMLLSKFKDEGWSVDGVELVTDAVKYAKKAYGIKLREGDFFDFRFKPESFDVIVMNGALEHVYNPRETVQRIYTLLKRSGVLIVTVPNVQSLGRQIFGRDWFPWQPPRHLYHFSPTTMRLMLTEAGYRTIDIKHNYDIQNKYILFQSLRYSKSPKFEKKPAGGLAHAHGVNKPSHSPKVLLGKIAASVFANTLATIEPLIGKGEIMIVYAKKSR